MANLKTGVSRKQSTPNFPNNEHLFSLIRTQETRNVHFLKFGVLCFLETPVLRFVLLPYYRRIVT